MLNNLNADAPIVQDMIRVMLEEQPHLCDAEDVLAKIVDTRDTVEDFKRNAESHSITQHEMDGIVYHKGTIKTSAYKNAIKDFVAIERDGWSVVWTS